MGKGGGGTTTTSTNSPPPQVLAAYQNVINRATQVAGQPLQQYQGPLVAGFTPDQLSSFNTVDQSQGIANPYLNAATNAVGASQTPIWNSAQQFSPQGIAQYQSPYTSQVVNATEAQLQNTDAQQQQQVIGNAQAQGAFGGDRVGIAQAALAGQQAIANNSTIANLENTGYTQALQEFNTQQQAQIGANEANSWLDSQAGFAYGNLGNEAQNTALTGAAAQAAQGSTQQQEAQAAINVPYEQFTAAQAYPFQTTQFLGNISEGIGGAEGGSSSTTQQAPNSLLGIFGLKRGGAVRGFSDGGGIASYDNGGMVPDVSVSFIPGASQMSSMGGKNSLPQPPQPAQQQKGPDAASLLANAKAFNSAGSWIGNQIPISNSTLLSNGVMPGASSEAEAALADDTASFAPAAATTAAADASPGIIDSLLAFLARGGRIPQFSTGGGISHHRNHFDDGGTVGGLGGISAGSNPVMQNQYKRLAALPTEKLQEMAVRTPPSTPQGQLVQRILAQKQLTPQTAQATQSPDQNSNSGIALPSIGGAQAAPQGYADGGDTDNDQTIQDVFDPDHELQSDAVPATPSQNYSDVITHNDNSAPSSKSSGIAAAGKGRNGPDPETLGWIGAGLGLLAGRSPYILQNIGEGGLKGLDVYKQARSADQEASRLAQQAEDTKDRLAMESKHYDAENQHYSAMEDLDKQRVNQGKFQFIPGTGTDGNGNEVAGTYIADTKGGTTTFQPGTNLTRRGNAGTPLTPLEVENLAKSAATNDYQNYQKDPEGTLDKWRQYYQKQGAPPAAARPAASPAGAPPARSAPVYVPPPAGVPAGSAYSPSTQTYKARDGSFFDSAGNRL